MITPIIIIQQKKWPQRFAPRRRRPVPLFLFVDKKIQGYMYVCILYILGETDQSFTLLPSLTEMYSFSNCLVRGFV